VLAAPSRSNARFSENFHRKVRRSEALIVRRACGAQENETELGESGGGSANPKILGLLSPSDLLIFL
jgi:hypothetical protein